MEGHHHPVVAPAGGRRVVVPGDQGGHGAGQLLGEGGPVAAEANRTSPSTAKVATRWRALAAPVMRSPTSRTSREATARSQAAETRSGARPGSGSTADSAAGEIT